jgi:AAA domain, putative AbiEii toxin, Type IV TA system/AAA ATPase domain
MITKLSITNFKRLGHAEVELGGNVVLIGPNNSGKSSALQALTLWDAAWRRWSEKREKKDEEGNLLRRPAKVRPGVTLNRRDLHAIPVPSAKLLWKDLHTHVTTGSGKDKKTDNVVITIEVEGIVRDAPWHCAMEFYYANEESFYCRLAAGNGDRLPEALLRHPVVFLPPMSGLADREFRKEKGEISMLIGQGQTAQVLRNLCWQLYSREDKEPWKQCVQYIRNLFSINLGAPEYSPENSSLSLAYTEPSGIELDISASGRGCQQVTLLLAFLLANPGAILLLDEPDAHLEILRQRDVYNLLTEVAASQRSQIIAASHSATVMQEAGERDVLVAFLGAPHRVDTRSRQNQIKKALESIPMADFYQAEQMGWTLYLEGATDLAILRQLAGRMDHPAFPILNDKVPVVYLGSNKPGDARNHFDAMREARPGVVGFALFDRLPDPDTRLGTVENLRERMWLRREIENYLVTRASLIAYVQLGLRPDDLFDQQKARKRVEVVESCILELEQSLRTQRRPDPWSSELKVADEFLDPLFANYYEKLGLPQQTFKRDYQDLAKAIALHEIAPEVNEVLDDILQVATKAKPDI